MSNWNELSTTVKALLIIGLVAVIGLLIALILNLSGSGESSPPPTDIEPTFTPTPAAAQLPSGPTLIAETAVNVRIGPGTEYPEIGGLQAGETAQVSGRSEDGAWYAIPFASDAGDLGWVAAEYVKAANIEGVPVIAPAPLPGQDATPIPEADAPQAVIAAPVVGQVGVAVPFSAAQSTGSSPLVQYAWTFGDGTVADAVVVEKTYTAVGAYLVNLAVVDGDGQKGAAQHQIVIESVAEETLPEEGESIEVPDSMIAVSVDGAPAAVSVVGGIPSFDAGVGQVVRLDASPAQGLYPTLQVIWDMGDGTTEVAGIAVEHTYAAAGSYQIVIAATDGQQSETKLWQVNVTE